MTELRSIKTVVLGLTVIMALMFGAVIWGLSRETALPPPRSAPAAAWTYTLPTGTITGVNAAGNDLAITLDTPEGREIIIFDPASQRVRGTVIAGKP
jgi:hypothetical protein